MSLSDELARALASLQRAQVAKRRGATRRAGPASTTYRTGSAGAGLGAGRKAPVSRTRRVASAVVSADPIDAMIDKAVKEGRITRSGGASGVRSPLTRLPTYKEDANDLIRRQAAIARANRAEGGNLISRLGSDFLDVATGIPSLAVLGGKVLASPVTGALEAFGAMPEGYSGRLARDVLDVGKGAVKDVATRWGPFYEAQADLLTGNDPRANYAKGLRQLSAHPGLAALDVGAVVSGLGGGLRVAAKAGGRAARGTAVGAKLERSGSKSIEVGSARHRPPKVRSVEMGENTAKGLKKRSLASVAIPRRALTSNPATRPIQRAGIAVAGRVAHGVERRVADSTIPLLQMLSRQGKFNRAETTVARDFRMNADFKAADILAPERLPYDAAVRALDRAGAPGSGLSRGGVSKWTSAQVDGALYLHGIDALDVPGKTVVQARDAVVAKMQTGLDAAITSKGVKSKFSQKTIDTLASVPPALLDLRRGPKELRVAVEEYKNLARKATDARVKAGTITRETANAARLRPAKSVHEGVHYDRQTDSWTKAPDPNSPVGINAVYTPDLPVDPLRVGKAGSTAGAFGRMTQDRVRQSHGVLFGMGNVNIGRGLPIAARATSIVDQLHPTFVKNFYDTFAFRRPNGEFSVGKRAISAMEADPANVTLLSRKSLDSAMSKLRELPEGELPDNPLAGVKSYSGTDGLLEARNAANKGDLVAFPKASITGIREGWNSIRGGKHAWFDTPQRLWKLGILGFAPRYYFNSTIGNSTLYWIHTGGDIRSLWQASLKRETGRVVPGRISGSTNVIEVASDISRPARNALVRGYTSSANVGMRFQSAMDAFFKRADYIYMMKKNLRQSGSRTRGLSNADLAKMIDDAPMELKYSALKESELFFGDYLRLSPLERATLRRVFPFYTWMRVIAKIMMVVPVRYPKRTAMVALLSRASADVVNPDDPLQSLFNRGRINVGDYSMRTAGVNPFFTLGDPIANVFAGDVQGALGAAASSTSPLLQPFARSFSGTTWTGAPVTFPPGYGGTAQSYGGPVKRINPVTQLPDYFTPTVPWSEQALQTIPLAPQLARGVLSGNRKPYDTTTTLDLALRRKPDSELFRPEYDRAMTPIPYLGPLLGWAGLNFQQRDRAAEALLYQKTLSDFKKSQHQTSVRQRKAARR